jgi:hypothetical protein
MVGRKGCHPCINLLENVKYKCVSNYTDLISDLIIFASPNHIYVQQQQNSKNTHCR